MLFHSQSFILLFLPAAVGVYYLLAGSTAARQWVLIAVSLLFYGWWDARFIPLLLGQITATWLAALLNDYSARNVWIFAGIGLNIAALATFKYLDFLMNSLEAVTGVGLPRFGLILPIGISFFSFQLVSYLVDRLRRDAPIYAFRPFALFVLLFPHLIAGPIVRHDELIPQLAQDPRRDGVWFRFGSGLTVFTIGLAKKVLVADRLTEYADPLFDAATRRLLTFQEAWNAALAFTFQLFLDFSAYSEMAIGIALLFGLVLPDNFRRPYLALDLQDFWRRWHMTLSKFIRDYLYIPLGGSRHGEGRYVLATLGAMGVCGLWHGAGWTYVVWGLWHGVGLIGCRAWRRLAFPLPVLVSWTLTALFVIAGWVIFRSADISTAGGLMFSLLGGNGFGGSFRGSGLITAGALLAVLVPSAHEIKDRWAAPWPSAVVALAILLSFCILEVGKGPPASFVYFQF